VTKIVNDPTSPICLWVSPDGAIIEFRYIVTQHESEGPERLEFRTVGEVVDLPHYREDNEPWQDWAELPADQGEPPKEVMEHFHGPLIKYITCTECGAHVPYPTK